MRRLLLSLPTLGERSLLLAALDGDTELLVDPDDPACVGRLLERLLAETSGAGVDVDEMLCVWRDRVFAALFTEEFGARVASEARCSVCSEQYAFGFDLTTVLRDQQTAAAATGLALDADGRWSLGGAAWLRPPTVADVREHPDPDDLAGVLCGGTATRERVDAVLDEAAPLLCLDLETRCAACREPQVLRFDIVRYTLESLAAERPLLIREAHLIASRYGWGHDTIMALPRADRRAYAGLILGERTTLRSA